MLESDHAIHLAVVDSEASQQVDGAIADVFELAACWPTACRWPTGYRRLVGRRWSANADARLLIDAEQWTISGWAEEQFDDGHGFLSEVGVTIIHPGVKDGPGEPGDA